MPPTGVPPSLWLLVLGGCLLAAARRDPGAPDRASSGRFVGPEQHACGWRLVGGAAGRELALSCQGPGGASYQCVYPGPPPRCAPSAARRARYWKRLLGRLRREPLPCRAAARPRAHLCAAARPASRAPPRARPAVAGFPREPQPGARGQGRPREPAPRPAPGAWPPASTPSKEKPSKKDTQGGKKGVSSPDVEPPGGTGLDLDGLDANTKVAETYCAEKWHSLCRFFVNVWNG
ncbi:fibroblast growth factor-binding protein 3 [Tenrec ecaudatus]|uniref:fibroblast growth factor-binding protein 3 n=1 Tax=Tenrec ecaudatus TaxID=94439 RepID=UPI003F5ABEE2